MKTNTKILIRGATSIKQLILPFFQSTQLNFENFYIGNDNLELVKSLQKVVEF